MTFKEIEYDTANCIWLRRWKIEVFSECGITNFRTPKKKKIVSQPFV
jgi:hypothetical protein